LGLFQSNFKETNLEIKKSTESDHELYHIVKQRLDPFKEPISYAEIAKSAFASGHSVLAIQLLEHESNPTHQVPLLLSMDEDLLALQKATQGSDTELCNINNYFIL
jgi:hypothetical protein